MVALAATHSPEELNFVLVDFKGGATFLGCEALPHTSAVITNLEEEALLVERMYEAISGELNRRQKILRAAGNFANITDYTAARAAGREALDPLPALLIVVDEFSELLSHHPHFADLFAAVGRLGRSLGVHLLLASQRLEEGRLRGLDSHLSYRIGLRTFSAAESRHVLGVVDAHELPAEPGTGFLKTGAGELTRFRAAYVSGPLVRRTPGAGPASDHEVGRFTGWDYPEPADDPSSREWVDESLTLLQAVVGKAQEAASRGDAQAHQVWLPPLPAMVELAAVCEDAGFLRAIIGLTDEPFTQRQDPLVIDFSESGGHVAITGGPQSGKSMAVKTIVASLAATHTTDQLAVYAIDAGSGDLAVLASLPHVAGVASRGEEERVRRIVDEVTGFLGDSSATAQRHTLLVIDGWHALTANDSTLEDLRDPLARIASEGPASRIHLLATTQRWSALRGNVRDLFGTRLELRLTDPLDSLIDRKAQAALPTSPGRGLTAAGTSMLVAATFPQDVAHIATTCASQPPVPRLRILPDHVDIGPLIAAHPGALPLGIGGPSLADVTCRPGHLLALGGTGCGKSTLIAGVIAAVEGMGRDRACLVIVDPRRAHLGRAREDMVAAYSATPTATSEALAAAATTLRGRLPGPDVTPEQLGERNWWTGPDIWVVIDDAELVADDALRQLLTLVPHARDIGMHLVVARKAGGASRAFYGGFFAAFKDIGPDVLLFDIPRDEGTLFGVKPTARKPGRAVLVRGNESFGTLQVAAPYAEGEEL
ncbi:ESX-1 secretion system protein EccCb1 [Corynebacterium capitovis DSM 44611]|uniref:type VII secretion protein EccCb n=1 Tax=Corynebacterium capitovis TaxID=131081 RepID=UPI0003699A66|nr:type VII secretion protein EccCb [Corynebacterium capitovis]WKD56902.1 ESX-1 secretion system protein EccCb1 [Corynebacterium capitovis DSM 44611]